MDVCILVIYFTFTRICKILKSEIFTRQLVGHTKKPSILLHCSIKLYKMLIWPKHSSIDKLLRGGSWGGRTQSVQNILMEQIPKFQLPKNFLRTLIYQHPLISTSYDPKPVGKYQVCFYLWNINFPNVAVLSIMALQLVFFMSYEYQKVVQWFLY